MSIKITKSDLFEELSAEKQELLAGGQRLDFDMGGFDRFDRDERDFDRDRDSDRDRRDSDSRIRRIPIRLTGILEVVK